MRNKFLALMLFFICLFVSSCQSYIDPRLKDYLTESAPNISLMAHPTVEFIESSVDESGHLQIKYKDRLNQNHYDMKFKIQLDDEQRIIALDILSDEGTNSPFMLMDLLKQFAKSAIDSSHHISTSFVQDLLASLASSQIEKFSGQEICRIIMSLQWEDYKLSHPLPSSSSQ